MFLVTNRTGTILDNVRLMEGVLCVTGFTSPINRLKGNAVTEPITNDLQELLGAFRAGRDRCSFVTFPTIVSKCCMRRRNGTGCKERLRTLSIVK